MTQQQPPLSARVRECLARMQAASGVKFAEVEQASLDALDDGAPVPAETPAQQPGDADLDARTQAALARMQDASGVRFCPVGRC